MSNFRIDIQAIYVEFIEFKSSLRGIEILPSWIELEINNVQYRDYLLTRISENENIFRITPEKHFDLYDDISIWISNGNYTSNCLNIQIAKSLHNHTGLTKMKIPSLKSGIYKVNLKSVSGKSMGRELEIGICNGINESLSYIEPKKNQYASTEDVEFQVQLYDTERIYVPSGKYEIYFEIEEINNTSDI